MEKAKMYFCTSNKSFSELVGWHLHDGASGFFEEYENGDLSGRYHLECLGMGVIPFKDSGYLPDEYSDMADNFIAFIRTENMNSTEAVNHLYSSGMAHLIDFESFWNKSAIVGFSGNKEAN